MSDADWTPDELRHFARLVIAAFKRCGPYGAYHRMATKQLSEDFDLEVLRPLLPAHVPMPVAPVMDPRHVGLGRIAGC